MTLNSSEHHLVLVGNYVPDNQTSMARFAEWVDKGLRKSGWKVDVIKPPVVFAKRAKSTLSGIGKWLGYIDKFILFPHFADRSFLAVHSLGNENSYHLSHCGIQLGFFVFHFFHLRHCRFVLIRHLHIIVNFNRFVLATLGYKGVDTKRIPRFGFKLF